MSLLNKGNTPSIDLHGESKDIAIILVKDFIFDNYRLNKKQIVIVHGIGSGILKNAVHQELSKNQYVKNYKIDFFNVGSTIVTLKSIDK